MKKFLLLLTAITLSLGTAMADSQDRTAKQYFKANKQPASLNNQFKRLQAQPAQQKSATRAGENGYTIQFSEEVETWFYLEQRNKLTYKCYLYITPELATSIAGNKITSITFSAASKFNTTREGSVFVAESLDGAPTTSTACTVINSLNSAGYCQTVDLNEPYTIKAGVGFFFGYEVKACRVSLVNGADYPVAVDYMAPNGFSGFVDIYDDATGKLYASYDMAEDVGTNLFLAAQTVGEAEGFVNLFTLGNLCFENFAMPVINGDDAGKLLFPVRNIGGNALTSIEYSLDVNGKAGEVVKQDVDVAPRATEIINLSATPVYQNGYNTVTLNVKKINGVENSLSTSAYCIKLANGGYDRKFVVEEATGTWCGYCPRGIVGMKKMSERYPDTFIGIAVHGDDDLESETYGPLVGIFDGFPSSIINRDFNYIDDPNEQYLEAYYQIWKDQRSPAKVELKAGFTEEGFRAIAATTFDYDETNAQYSIAFAILEDGLMDTQENYYSGNPGALEWWGEQDKTVLWSYEDTAIDIFDLGGIAGSVPSTIKAGLPTSFAANLSAKNVTNKNNASIVALLIDGRSGVILNAAKVKANDFTDDITDVEMSAAPVVYYNLQGIRVQNAQPGSILIRRQGDKAVKTVVR